MAEQEQNKTKTYRGNCHCGAFIYEIDLPEISHFYSCNCSICTKKSYLWTLVPDEDAFKVVKGNEDDLTVYKFGPKQRPHKVTNEVTSFLRMIRKLIFCSLFLSLSSVRNADQPFLPVRLTVPPVSLWL